MTGQTWTFGALFVMLNRLEKKGLLDSFLTESIPQRGGRSKRIYKLTPRGRMAESNVQKAYDSFRSEFLKLVLLSNLLAWPFAYYVSHSWLQRFAYRIGLSFAPFLFSGMLAMIIAFITVSFLSIKAAKANPVDSLRYE